MKRLMLANAAFLLTFASMSSVAIAGFVTFAGLDRGTIISTGGQTFSWSSDGESGTVLVRPVGSLDALNPTVPNTANGRGPSSNFHTGVHTSGGPVGVSFEFLFSRPIDITVYNTETLSGRERMTYQTDGDPWTGGWYSVTQGNIVGLGTQTIELTPIPPTPPHPFGAFSSKGVTRFEYTNELLALPTQMGSIGNGIEIQIDAVAVPEPSSIHFVVSTATVLACCRTRRRSQRLGAKWIVAGVSKDV